MMNYLETLKSVFSTAVTALKDVRDRGADRYAGASPEDRQRINEQIDWRIGGGPF